MSIDAKAYQKELLENWFKGVGEKFTPENVWKLFDGYFLPIFSEQVPELSHKCPDYTTKNSDPLYQEKLDKYFEDNRKLRDMRKDLLLQSGYEHITSEGGGEGEGEYCYGVIKIGDTYLKAEWSYYSYDGCEYDHIFGTLEVVTPKQKTITVYE